MSVRVVLADDQAVVRAGFRALLDLTGDLVVVGEAVDGSEAIQVVRAARPDVVLMDVRMPVRDGIAATEAIRADPALVDTRVVVLTTFALDEYVVSALAAGASGFLLKDAEPDAVYDAIRRVAAGDAVLDPAVTGAVIEQLRRTATAANDAGRLDVLTDKEREVLGRVAAGRTNAEIGADLLMSPLTAKTHVSRIMGKLAARDRVQLVVIAHETGLA